MAKINSYPFDSAIQDDDAWIGSDSISKQTKQYTAEAVATYTIGGLISGSTVNTLSMFSGAGLVDSQLKQVGPGVNGTYQMKFENADRFIIDKPSSVTSGDPEYLITQDGNAKVSMGWDDDGEGFGFLYNWAGDGWRFGSAGNNPELTIVTTAGQEGVTVANNLIVDGKVGVGTTTPLANLDVKETTTDVAGQIIVGGLIESSTDDKPFGKLCFANTANANSQPNKILASIEGRKNGSSNRGILTFGAADGSGSNWEKMRIDSYGYVGIGTTSPQRELDVAGNVRITGTLDLLQKNSNTFVGTGTGNLPNTTGSSNTALGSESLNNNTGGNGNTAVGRQTLHNNTGNNNTGTGSLALFSNTTGLQNTGIGRQALQNVTTGDCNVGIGHIAGALVNGGAENTNPFYSVFIGGGTKSKTNNDTNQIVIGRNAIGEGTNTARIGNTSVSQLHVGGNGAGIVLKSPNGTAYIIKVTDAGALTVTAL